MRPDLMRVCVLRCRGGGFNKFKATFKGLHHFEVHLSGAEDATSRGELLRKEIEKRNIKASHAAVGLSPSSARTITTNVPGSVLDVSSWIAENIQKLFRIPISASEVAFGYEPLQSSGPGKPIEITIARRKDIEHIHELAASAKLELVAISVSSREALTALQVSGSPGLAGEAAFVNIDQNVAQVSYLSSGRRSKTEQVLLRESHEFTFPNDASQSGCLRNDVQQIFAGEVTEDLQFDGAIVFTPFGLPSKFSSAVGLAVKPFLPDLSPVNLLETSARSNVEVRFAKNLFHRVTIATGAVLMLLLFSQMIATFVVHSWSERVDNELLSMGPSYFELKQLENELHDLRKATEGPSAILRGSRYSEILHDIAACAPEGLWLTKLKIGKNPTNTGGLYLEGYAKASDLVAAFLKTLRNRDVCREVRLTRSGSDEAPGSTVPAGFKGRSYTTFVIDGKI